MTRRASASAGRSGDQPTWTWTPVVMFTPVAPGLEDPGDLGDLGQALRPAEDRADDLAGVAAAAGADRPVVLGLPAGGQVRDLDAVVVRADPQAVVGDSAVGGDRFDLDSKVRSLAFIVFFLALSP